MKPFIFIRALGILVFYFIVAALCADLAQTQLWCQFAPGTPVSAPDAFPNEQLCETFRGWFLMNLFLREGSLVIGWMVLGVGLLLGFANLFLRQWPIKHASLLLIASASFLFIYRTSTLAMYESAGVETQMGGGFLQSEWSLRLPFSEASLPIGKPVPIHQKALTSLPTER